MAKFVTAQDAIKFIKNGDTVIVTGFVGNGVPEELLEALSECYKQTQAPNSLTFMYAAGQGDGKERGLNRIAHEGLVKRVIGGHWNLAPKLGKLAIENKIEAYNLPQGTITHWFREIAGRKPGVITKVGLNTFVDPRVEGGKINDVTKEEIVEVLNLNGEEWLWYKPFKVDVAFIRATYADRRGNLSFEKESVLVETLPAAQAVKANGGIVIAQVEKVVENGELNCKAIQVPGMTVDYVVECSNPAELHKQTNASLYNPAYSGQERVQLSSLKPMELDERKIVARRAAIELPTDAAVNLGIGMPEGVAMVAAEEGIGDTMTLTVEAGPIGGVPAGGGDFGSSTNPDVIMKQHEQFDFYDGGGLDITFLGLAETDSRGNLNVSKFKGRVAGCGGFINISQNTNNVIFCGTFTAGGLKVEIKNGQLTILEEGRNKKFLQNVEQITFSGDYANKVGQNVLYITERAVFKLTPNGLELVEIAPGIDLDKDILAQMDFKPIISTELQEMDARIFRPELMGLGK